MPDINDLCHTLFLHIKLIIEIVIQIYSLGTLKRIQEFFGSNYQNTDKG